MNPWLFADGVSSAPSLTAAANYSKELLDTISCVVEREINGIYELTMTYPVDGDKYDDIGLRSLLYVSPDDVTARQLFRIYRISKPLRGVVTINARHIAYDLAGYVTAPITATSITTALTALTASTEPSGCPFTFSTTRTSSVDFNWPVPSDIWSLLAGQEGSLLDIYGGEWDFDNFTVTFALQLGSDNGVVIEYGKNLTQLLQEENMGNLCTGVRPYWYTEADGLVTTANIIASPVSWPFTIYKALDVTDKFETKPTVQALTAWCLAHPSKLGVWNPTVTLEVDFVPLWQTQEYKNDPREHVGLGDTVHVKFTKLGVDASARAVATTYDCLKERYTKITIGSAKADLAQVIRRMIGKTIYDNHEAWD